MKETIIPTNKSSHNFLLKKLHGIFTLFILSCVYILLLSFGGCSDKWENMECCESESIGDGHVVVHLKSHDWCYVWIFHPKYKIGIHSGGLELVSDHP